MGMEVVPETLEDLHIWTQLSAWENFIEDKMYVASVSVNKVCLLLKVVLVVSSTILKYEYHFIRFQ
jgi:hypothetical protein